MKFRVIDDVYTVMVREPSSDDSWDQGDDTAEQHDIKGIVISKEKNYYDLETSINLDKNKTYYLVSVFYDTGSSFGRSNNRVEHIDIFETREKAYELAKLIEQNENNYQYGKDTHRETRHSITYTDEAGNKKEISCWSWQGYFEVFREATVTEVEVLE